MSLINDALRRAKQVQKQTPSPSPSASLQLRPVEPEAEPQKSTNLFVPGVLVVVAVIVAAWIAHVGRKDSAESIATRARAAEAANASSDARAAAAPRPVTPTAQQKMAPDQAPGEQAGAVSATRQPPFAITTGSAINPPGQEEPRNTPNPATSAVAASSNSPAQTNPLPVALASPQPVPLKLQGIVWDPTRPSAVINGRTLFVGERFAEFRVRAITPDTVTLVGKGQTNLLQLDQ